MSTARLFQTEARTIAPQLVSGVREFSSLASTVISLSQSFEQLSMRQGSARA